MIWFIILGIFIVGFVLGMICTAYVAQWGIRSTHLPEMDTFKEIRNEQL